MRRGNLNDDAAGGMAGHVLHCRAQQDFAQGVGLVVAHDEQFYAALLGLAHLVGAQQPGRNLLGKTLRSEPLRTGEYLAPRLLQHLVICFDRRRHGKLDHMQGDQLCIHAPGHLAGQRHQTLRRIRVPERHHHFGLGRIPLR